MERRLTTLMVADLVGYSTMMEADPDAALAAIHSLRAEFLEPVAAAHGGEVLKRMGDGWIIAFGGVGPAIEAARAVQAGLAEHPAIRLRIGCHVGEIVIDEDDFYGAGVNLAQRIQTEAPPGGVMVSEDLRRQLPPGLAEDFTDAGAFQLRNIARPLRLYQWRPRLGGMPARGAGDVPSIAVGPVAFAPADDATAAVAGDIRDQLLIRLSRRRGMRIIDDEARVAADATYDLRCRLRLAGARGRLSVALMLRADASPVWSENYEDDAADVFAFCDRVLEQAESDLRVQTNAFDGDRLAHLPSDALSISELRSRAANLFYRMSYESWSEGLALMERAVKLNPDDPVALAMRAEAVIMCAGARDAEVEPARAASLARDLDAAVEAAHRSDYVLWTRGFFRASVLHDPKAARSDLARSRELNPAYAENHELEGLILLLEGDAAGAAQAFGRLTSRGASNIMLPYRLYLRGVAHLCAGAYAAAAEDAAAAADFFPSDRRLRRLQALAADKAGDAEAAARLNAEADALPDRPSAASRRIALAAGDAWVMTALGGG